jgi:dipeptidyl aminopeptidase/acylaminoacyl peptidase
MKFMKAALPLFLVAFVLCVGTVTAQKPVSSKQPLDPKAVYDLQVIGSPFISPEGEWILHTTSKADAQKDKSVAHLYMTKRDGSETITLTAQTKGVTHYAWSPDGKYISYLSAGKEEKEGDQLYLMDRRGGEPIQLTHIKGEIENYIWTKEVTKLIFEIKDPNFADTAHTKIRKPYEIDRYHFKADYEGYLDNRKTHLYLFDLHTKKLDTLTSGANNETQAAVSNDGKWLAFASNVSPNYDQNDNTDIFVMPLMVKAKPVQYTFYKGADHHPFFSPDNTTIAFLRSSSEDAYDMYDLQLLGVLDIKNQSEKIISKKLDLSLDNIIWSIDGKSIMVTAEDDRKQNILQFNSTTGEVKQLTNGMGVFNSVAANDKGQMVALFTGPNQPSEIFSYEGNNFKQVTHIQDSFINKYEKINVKGFTATASDGNKVNGILYVKDSSAKKLPLVLFIHGGPVAQDEFGFDLTRQIYAAAGYAVAAVNYRGSSGRGANYTKCIYGDWGNKEVKDIIGVADYLIASGIADASKMAIAGWSYGGILTNYTIATDHRFKAAVSGAGSSLMLSFYGTDQYISQYEPELGKPWENIQKWIDVSYPFFKVKEIKTPTLFMASEADFNVPVVGAEQMYQAFKSVGLPTQLIIYPNQNHGIRVPSYLMHRYQSHLDWFKKYLN